MRGSPFCFQRPSTMALMRSSSSSRTFAASSAVTVRSRSSAVITSECADGVEMPSFLAIWSYVFPPLRISRA